MSGECPVHGPYDGPVCPHPPPHVDYSRSRPPRPDPLRDDDQPTSPGGGGYVRGAASAPDRGRRNFDDEAETAVPPGRGRYDGASPEDDAPTVVDREGIDITLPPKSAIPIVGLLWVKQGAKPGKIYPIRNNVVIGRNWEQDGDLVLDDRGVSGRHAKIRLEKGHFFIWDLGSTYGTAVNGRPIREATLLEENDLIKIGDTVFVVKLLDAKSTRKSARRAGGRKKTSDKSKG